MRIAQPILKKDLGWLGEKMGELRYPPYDEKMLGMIRSATKNRQVSGHKWKYFKC